MGTIDISYYNLFIGLLLLAIPFFYLWKFKTGLLKPAVIGTLRMIIQLFFIGMYLKYLFLWNNPWINFLWVIIMVFVHLQFGKYSSYKQIYSLVFRHINKVTELSGVKKKVTYYSARKTFAQHGYDLGIQIEKIEYCIGHSMKNNRPIFNYIKIMQEHADKVFRAVLDQLL